jgi:alanine racemase
VACTEEAMELRESQIHNPIVLLEGAFEPAEVTNAAMHDFVLVVHNQHQLDWLLKAHLARPLDVWLKVDTGMHRLGFAPSLLPSIHARLSDSSNVNRIVLMTHFARADETDDPATERQAERFANAGSGIETPHSLANSAATLAWPGMHRDWIRPGIMLYGSSPIEAVDPRLKPVMRLESRLIAIREIEHGESVGYGARFTCRQRTRVGVVAIGYADGYPRHAPDGTPVAVNGTRTRLIGRVSMDMLTVDLSDQPDAAIGDRVQLWGDLVAATEVAQASGTISYELFTRINRRVHFRYS